MINAMIAVALLGSAPGGQVDVGRINQNSLPSLKAVERSLPTAGMVERVERILESGQCTLQGQTARRFDITVPYAVLVEPDGSAGRVVVQETGCEPLESYVGLVVLTLAREGDFAKSRGPQARWFTSEINFNLE
jgi:hypothetical protein